MKKESTEGMSALQALLYVQRHLVVPKKRVVKLRDGRVKYPFRSCEDILREAKPLCDNVGAVVTMDDKAIFEGGIVTITSFARFTMVETGEFIETHGNAGVERIGDTSLAQAFGASSSYARKYALCGLFAIDDSQDADACDAAANGELKTQPVSAPAVNKEELQQAIDDLMCTSTDRASFEEAWRRHGKFHNVEAFKNTAAKIALKYPKHATK